MANSEKRIDLRKALLNPALVFLGPEDVLKRDELTREQKIEVLRRWKFDALRRGRGEHKQHSQIVCGRGEHGKRATV